MDKSEQDIIVEQIFNAPIDQVWNAITNLKEMKQWFFKDIPDFKPEVGFKVNFPVISRNNTFTHLWEILEVEPQKLIKYHWTYKEYPGECFVTFELFEKGTQTLLRLSNEGLESFPQDIPEFERDSCVAGWEYFINGMLKNYLERK